MDIEPSSKQQEIQSLSALEALTAAHKTNLIPNQEYLLQGSILDNHVEFLLHRLRGLCDNVDIGLEKFHDHEMCFVLGHPPGHPGQGLSLRVRRALDDPHVPMHLRYVGQPELGDKNRPTMVRSILDVACGSEVVDFLKELGCRKEFDFVSKGYIFRKGRLKIVVAKMFRLEPGKVQPSEPVLEPLTQSHYVEMSVVTPSGQDVIGEDMKNLSEQLKPLVTLDKVDHRRMP